MMVVGNFGNQGYGDDGKIQSWTGLRLQCVGTKQLQPHIKKMTVLMLVLMLKSRMCDTNPRPALSCSHLCLYSLFSSISNLFRYTETLALDPRNTHFQKQASFSESTIKILSTSFIHSVHTILLIQIVVSHELSEIPSTISSLFSLGSQYGNIKVLKLHAVPSNEILDSSTNYPMKKIIPLSFGRNVSSEVLTSK